MGRAWGWMAANRLPTVAFVTALVMAIGVGSWFLDARSRAAHVSASWRLRCPASEMDTYHGAAEIESRPGWRCDVRLRVHNRGSHPIHVSHVEAPLFGPAARAEVRGFSRADAVLDHDSRPGSGSLDGGYVVDTDVPAHSTRTIDLRIGWRERSCDDGGHFALVDWPTVVFETLHRTFRYTSHKNLWLHTYSDPHDSVACPD